MQPSAIGNFTIIEKIGEGGMGEVFKGFDTMLEREVAIKSLRPELTSHKDLVARFKTEAIALARLNHPNITTLYSFFQHDGQYFMVMEFAHGMTLSRLIKDRGAIPIPDAVKMIGQALDGLDHAHSMGIIHKDIKPANIMFTDRNTIKLMDFGIARILEKSRLTQTGHLVGTLKYMSPEQLCGAEASPQVDIYSLGAVLYEVVTGRAPFEANSDYALMKAKVETDPPLPQSFNAKVPNDLQSVILKALHKQPQKRYASAQDFSRALQAVVARPAVDDPQRTRSIFTQLTVVEKTKKSNTGVPRPRNWFRRYGGAIALFLATVTGALIFAAGNFHNPALDSLFQTDPTKADLESPFMALGFEKPENDSKIEAGTPQINQISQSPPAESELKPPADDQAKIGDESAPQLIDAAPKSDLTPAKAEDPAEPVTSLARTKASPAKIPAAKVSKANARTNVVSAQLTDKVSPPRAPESKPLIVPAAGWGIEK